MGGLASILLLCPQSSRAQILFNPWLLDGSLPAYGFLPATVENRAKVFPEKYDEGVQWSLNLNTGHRQRQESIHSMVWDLITLYC